MLNWVTSSQRNSEKNRVQGFFSQPPARLELEGTLDAIVSDFPLNSDMCHTITRDGLFRCPFLSPVPCMDSADPGITVHREVSLCP